MCWPGPLLLALVSACAERTVSTDLEAEVQRVRRASIPEDAGEVELPPRQDTQSSARWSWRFTTQTPAAPYRTQLMAALAPAYACREARRYVSCTRTLPGDSLQLRLQAHPSLGETLVKATLTARAD